MAKAKEPVTIDQICNAFRRYYVKLDKTYDDTFTDYCEENGFAIASSLT